MPRKHPMMDNDFDPYQALIDLDERMNRLEFTHNNLAREFQRTQTDINVAIQSLNSLQKSHLSLSKLVSVTTLGNIVAK